jgi:hypothetical protein
MKNIIITFLLTLFLSFLLVAKSIEKQYFNRNQIGYACSLIIGTSVDNFGSSDCEKIIYLLETN